MMTRSEAIAELVTDITSTAGQLPAVACYATAEVERDLRLAAETLDHALCRLQVARHSHTRSLLDEIEAGNHHR